MAKDICNNVMENNPLIILAEHNLQSSLIEQQLKLGGAGELIICEGKRFLDSIHVQQVDMVLVEYEYFLYLYEQDLLPDFDQLEIRFLIYNIPNDMFNIFFPQWTFLKGILFKNTSVEQLVNCVRCILAGGLWFPRHYLEKMIDHLRSHEHKEPSSFSQLSNREKQILQLVAQGKSNSGIAESLFLAESTVKTHVYKIYKKLNIHKRQQVINLVKQPNQFLK
ncbi:response regulator transcription factor [Vibrio sp. ABG19]|uniref:helix-turn-helix transcriptional regulator n=1 Tax=Vibrio sp. ABG19 TaxID=2817385 RepID=UPI00249EFF63|nr:response regulator transcription factor [Vibrio sp. ABG19]WGY46163.1 response regulator transcription factor [Vibrio sp. ABG19]